MRGHSTDSLPKKTLGPWREIAEMEALDRLKYSSSEGKSNELDDTNVWQKCTRFERCALRSSEVEFGIDFDVL